MSKIKDLTNQRFHRLLVIKPGQLKIQSKNFRIQHWICQCDCGNITEINGAKLRNGHTKSCGCLIKEKAADLLRGKAYRKKYSPMEASARSIWRYPYKKELPFEVFMKLTQQNCYYCNTPPSNVFNYSKGQKKSAQSSKDTADFKYSGIDRVDSNKGHTTDNCVSCCKFCNFSKRERSVEDFLKWVEITHLNIQNKKSLLIKKDSRALVGLSGEEINNDFLFKENLKIKKDKIYRKYNPIITSARAVWKNSYKEELSFEDFYRLSQQNCFYCNLPPSNKFNSFKCKKSLPETKAAGTFIYNGLDRIDSSNDHSVDNCVPCCKWCNISKRERTQEEFYNWLSAIYYFSCNKR